MLSHTFCHIQTIGPRTEERLWRSGILTWDDLEAAEPRLLPPTARPLIANRVATARHHLRAGKAAYFADSLPAKQIWRIFPHFRAATAYLDIETTGLGDYRDHITTIALYDGSTIRHYVHGVNLDDFVAALENYTVLVTYNGKCFDIPFIERSFGIRVPQAHIDLRYLLAGLGLKGGLKGCEKQLGLDRGDLEGVDGYFAVLLWHEYRATGNRRALETLLAYNIQDVVSLEILMVEAYNRNLAATPFAASHRLPPPRPPALPFAPDPALVRRLRQRLERARGW